VHSHSELEVGLQAKLLRRTMKAVVSSIDLRNWCAPPGVEEILHILHAVITIFLVFVGADGSGNAGLQTATEANAALLLLPPDDDEGGGSVDTAAILATVSRELKSEQEPTRWGQGACVWGRYGR
jgi:hypothetical protein